MPTTDQDYTLAQAIIVFARPEDQKNFAAAEQGYLQLVEDVPCPEPDAEEVAEWRKIDPHELEAIWRSRRRERFEGDRRRPERLQKRHPD